MISIEKTYRIIKFNRKAWLKPYIDRNTDLKKKQKLILKKTFFNAVFGKTMKNVRKNRDIKLVRRKKRNYLVSEPKYHTPKFYSEKLLAIETKKNLNTHG